MSSITESTCFLVASEFSGVELTDSDGDKAAKAQSRGQGLKGLGLRSSGPKP